MQQRHLLAAYGRDLGAAFQIADDVLDVEGDATEIGKTAGKDEAAGKATMVRSSGWSWPRPMPTCWPGRPRRTSTGSGRGRPIYAPWLLSWLSGEAD